MNTLTDYDREIMQSCGIATEDQPEWKADPETGGNALVGVWNCLLAQIGFFAVGACCTTAVRWAWHLALMYWRTR